MQRDMNAVADLVELCFAKTLDPDGHRYVHQMRAAAKNPGMLAATSSFAYSLGGYVWEEDGKLVGNLNMIPVYVLRQRAYLIANVAVHPDYRRRGIARALTDSALESIYKRGVRSVWLQVNAENPGAQDLYRSAGFLERARRTTWHSRTAGEVTPAHPPEAAITARQNQDWALQREWLRRLYPGEVSWHLPININLLRPGLSGTLSRIFSDRLLRQWSARLEGQLIGTLSWQSSNLQADWLWLGISPQYQELAIQSLLPYALKHRGARRTLAVDYPAGEATEAFVDAGFFPHQTLIWMHTQLS
jgi:ribosomal protein S18 acetylase RimI-like enzyme